MSNFFEFLKKGRTNNAIVAGDYTFKAKKNKCEVHRMIVNQVNDGSDNVLKTGIQVIVKHEGDEQVLTSIPIRSAYDWAMYCYDAQFTRESRPRLFRVMVRWSFFRSGKPIVLDKGDEIIVRVGDDMTGTQQQYFNVQGFYR